MKPLPGVLLLLCLLPVLTAKAESGGEPVDRWRDVLRYGIDSEIIASVEGIRQAGERSLDAELLAVFQDIYSTEVRLAILQYFRDVRYAGAREPVLALLGTVTGGDLEDDDLIVGLVRYFIDVPAPESVPVLISLLEHGDRGVAQAAITALGRSQSEQAGAAAAARLEDPDYPAELRPDLILALGSLRYAPAYEQLVAIIRDTGRERIERLYACDSLGKIGDSRAVAELKKLFGEDDSLVKMYAASALAHFSMDEVQDLLIQGLRDSNPRVRATSAKALADPRAERAVDILIYKADNDPEKAVRSEALRALGAIGGARALDYLENLYLSEEKGGEYREIALVALTEHQLPRALRAAGTLIRRDAGARNQAALEMTARRLAELKSPQLGSLYRELLGSINPALRIYALRGIGNNGFRDMRAEVEELSEKDPHPAVRQIAAAVLGTL